MSSPQYGAWPWIQHRSIFWKWTTLSYSLFLDVALESPKDMESPVFVTYWETSSEQYKMQSKQKQADSLAFGAELLMCKLSTYINESFQV